MLLWNAATGMRGHASSLEMHHEHGKLLGCAWRDETRWAITSAVRLREAERGLVLAPGWKGLVVLEGFGGARRVWWGPKGLVGFEGFGGA